MYGLLGDVGFVCRIWLLALDLTVCHLFAVRGEGLVMDDYSIVVYTRVGAFQMLLGLVAPHVSCQ